jgi:hypothetical protein
MDKNLIDICYKKQRKEIDKSWDQLAKENGYLNGETLRCSFKKYRKTIGELKSQNIVRDEIVDKKLNELQLQENKLYKERQKLRDEKSEYQIFLREQARMELFFERIDESINKLINKRIKPLPSPIHTNEYSDELFSAYADCHYGCEFLLKGFNGLILNEYNPEVFKRRMIEYRDELIDFGKLHNIYKLSLVDLGDSIEGILHLSQLKSLRGNIVDDIMDYADFIEEWLYSLSEYFMIDFYTSEGNHADLRLLTGKKNDFPHENLEKIYTRFLKKVFKNNPNIIIHDSLDGLNYFNVNGFNFLTAHGNKENNLKTSIQDYESTYGIKVDYFCVGHLHSKNEFEVAKGKEVIQVRSIMGINEFARDIKKSSHAGATMFVVRKGYGRKYINDVRFK